jgi:hypothetical protein
VKFAENLSPRECIKYSSAISKKLHFSFKNSNFADKALANLRPFRRHTFERDLFSARSLEDFGDSCHVSALQETNPGRWLRSGRGGLGCRAPFLFWAEDLTPMACLKVLTSAVSQDRDLETSAEIHSCRTSTRKRRPDAIAVAAFSLLPQ